MNSPLEEITKGLDTFITTTQPTGSIDKAIGNTLYGINHQQVKNATLPNQDVYGLTFFTRPQLNLQDFNLRKDRHFYNLLSKDPNSIQRYVRCMIDPRLNYDQNLFKTIHGTETVQGKVTSNLVDPNMGFIPLFTNTVKSVSGWPDIVMPSFTSKAGISKEQWIMADGPVDIYDAFDLNVNFRNIVNDPVSMLLSTWLRYMANVFNGNMAPYMDYISENRMDYNTRIYRLVLDKTKRYVKKIAATGVSFPTNDPTGKSFDFNDMTNYNDQTKDINVRFRSVGAIYNDPRLYKEFNEVSAIFNPDIRNMLKGKAHNLDKIPYEMLDMLNHRGYPIINIKTNELEWYISKSSTTYNRILAMIK